MLSGTKLPAALQQLQNQKTPSSAGYATAQNLHCQLHLSEVLRQPSLAGRFRKGKDAVKPQGNNLHMMPPRWPSGCNARPARSGLTRALRPYIRAAPLEYALDTPQHSTSPLRAMHMPFLSQVRLAAKLHTCYQDGEDQAGQLPACLPAVPGQSLLLPLWACTECFIRLDAARLPIPAEGLASPQLFVALHTAHTVVVLASATMPSPSAKLKASRRLPKRLRVSGEQPTGGLARSRAEAAERYARGESNKEGQHSCHQGRRRWQHASWDWHEGWGSDTWGRGWRSSAASGSGDNWTSRPQPPRPPSPRWRRRTGDSSAKCGPVELAGQDLLGHGRDRG